MKHKEVNFLPNEFTDFQVYPKILKNTNKDSSKKDALTFDYTGNNKDTLVLYTKKTDQNPEMLAFLTKMLKAVQYNIETDIVLLGIEEDFNLSFAQLKSDFSVKKIIAFGVSTQQLGIHGNIRAYSPVSIGNYQFLIADNLDVLLTHNAKKRQLWDSLKQMFL